MKIKKSTQLYYGLAGGALVLATGLLYLQKGALDDLSEQASQLRQTAQKQKNAKATLVSTQKDLSDLQAKLAHLEEGIPDAAYVPTMLKELEAMGKAQNMEMSGLRPSLKRDNVALDKKSADTKPYEPLDFELKGKASYADMLKFVAALNTFPKILEVRTLSLAPVAAGVNDNDHRLEMTIGLRAFMFKTATAPAKEVSST